MNTEQSKTNVNPDAIELTPDEVESASIQDTPESVVSAPDLSAYSGALSEQVDRTRRLHRDPLDAVTPATGNEDVFINVGAMLAAFSGAVVVIGEVLSSSAPANNTLAALSLGLPVGAVQLWLSNRNVKQERSKPIQLPDGYGLQTFYAKNPPSDYPNIGEHEVAVAILPRRHQPNEAESAAQARERLRDAIRVAHAARADKVIVPQSILLTSRVGLPANAMFGKVLQQASKRELDVPAREKPCVIMDAPQACEVADRLEIAETPWSMVFAALQRRYPNNGRLQLFNGEPIDLLPTLHGYLWRTASQELPGSISRLFKTESGDNFIRQRAQLITEVLPAGDQYNPTIHQYVPGHYSVGHDHKLSSLIAPNGDPEVAIRDIVARLVKNGGLEDFELLYLALQTIKTGQLNVDLDLPSVEQYTGSPPEFVKLHNYKEKKFRRIYFRQLAGRLALVAALAAPAAAYVHDLGGYLHIPSAGSTSANTLSGYNYGDIGYNSDDVNPNTGMGYADFSQGEEDSTQNAADQPEWKVTGYGENVDGYYTQELGNDLENDRGDVYWGDTAKLDVVALPSSLPDPGVPHITVEHWGDTGNGYYELPVKVGMRVAAIRVYDDSFDHVPIQIYKGEDGTYSVSLTSGFSSGEGIYISYDLVRDPRYSTRAMGRAQIDQSVPFHPNGVPKDLRNPASIGPARVAAYTRNSYRYINSPELNKLVDKDSANAIAAAVDHAKQCNCNVCAATEEIAEAAVGYKAPLAIAFGYRHSGGNFITPTEGHAFLLNGNGQVIDGTPPGSLRVPKASEQQLATTWQKISRYHQERPHFPNPKIPLEITGAISLGLIESQKKYAARIWQWRRRLLGGLAATHHLSPVDSYSLLEWAAFRGPNSPQPRFLGRPSPSTPADLNWRNIPVSTLQDAAKEGVPGTKLSWEQRDSVRKTASYVLRSDYGIKVKK